MYEVSDLSLLHWCPTWNSFPICVPINATICILQSRFKSLPRCIVRPAEVWAVKGEFDAPPYLARNHLPVGLHVGRHAKGWKLKQKTLDRLWDSCNQQNDPEKPGGQILTTQKIDISKNKLTTQENDISKNKLTSNQSWSNGVIPIITWLYFMKKHSRAATASKRYLEGTLTNP